MKRTARNTWKLPVLIAYTVVFYGVWTIWEFWGKSVVSNAIENAYISKFVKSGVIKNLVWTLPAALLVHDFKKDVYVGLKDMFTPKGNIVKYLPVFLILPSICLLALFFKKAAYPLAKHFALTRS